MPGLKIAAPVATPGSQLRNFCVRRIFVTPTTKTSQSITSFHQAHSGSRTQLRPLLQKNWTFAIVLALATLLTCATANAQTYSPLYTYSINSGAYSGIVVAGLVSQGRDGNLYSTIANNGTRSKGTTFKMSLAGVPTTLYNFCTLAGCTDGAGPQSGLILGADGNLYGTTTNGGAHNDGSVFKMTPAGAITTLWSFTAGVDEGIPYYPPWQAQDGNFWGVAQPIYSGTYGVAYKMTPSGALTPFPFNYTNGSSPNLPTQGTDGNFYGTARGGGAHGIGVVYKLTPAGVISVLHDFAGYPTEGNQPMGQLVQGSDGNFYGATYSGGASNVGTVFKISASGSFTNLYSFTGWGFGDGALPYSGLTVATDGNFYGSTAMRNKKCRRTLQDHPGRSRDRALQLLRGYLQRWLLSRNPDGAGHERNTLRKQLGELPGRQRLLQLGYGAQALRRAGYLDRKSRQDNRDSRTRPDRHHQREL